MNILKNNFNFTLIYSDKYYFSQKTQNEQILQKIAKSPISFDLSIFSIFFIALSPQYILLIKQQHNKKNDDLFF